MHQNVPEDPWAVGHDGVDTKVKEFVHLPGFVNGPHLHFESEAVGGVNEASVHDPDPSRPHRHLHTVAIGTSHRQPEARSSKPGNALGSKAGAQLRAESGAQPCQPAI